MEQSEHMLKVMLRENFHVDAEIGGPWVASTTKRVQDHSEKHGDTLSQQHPDSSVWRRQKDGKAF